MQTHRNKAMQQRRKSLFLAGAQITRTRNKQTELLSAKINTIASERRVDDPVLDRKSVSTVILRSAREKLGERVEDVRLQQQTLVTNGGKCRTNKKTTLGLARPHFHLLRANTSQSKWYAKESKLFFVASRKGLHFLFFLHTLLAFYRLVFCLTISYMCVCVKSSCFYSRAFTYTHFALSAGFDSK